MQHLIIYLLQLIILTGFFYTYYHLFLKNERFHQYNRFYLLISIVISISIPLIKIPLYITVSENANAFIKSYLAYNQYLALSEVVVSTKSYKSGTGFPSLILFFYCAISAYLFFKLAKGIYEIIAEKKRSEVVKQQPVYLAISQMPGTPFSFFNWIFWDQKIDIQSSEGEKIFHHEMHHAKAKHSIDIIFIEIISCLFWINPFFWLMKKEIKAIHEFLADQYASGNGQRTEYAVLLLEKAIIAKQNPLIHSFYNNQLKRRIIMLTTNNTTSFHYLKQIMIIPVFIILAGLFIISCKSKDEKVATAANTDTASRTMVTPPPVNIIDSSALQVDTPLIAIKKTSPGNAESKKNNGINPESDIYVKVEKEADYPGGMEAWSNFIGKNINPEVAVKNGASSGTYQVIVQFVVDVAGNVSDVKAIKDPGFGTAEEAIRVIKKSGKWKPAILNGKEVKAYRRQPITFQVQDQ